MKIKILTDVTITCDPPRVSNYLYRNPEAYAKEMERWVEDFHDFIRDHRSQDPVHLDVNRVYEDQCSHCHNNWEEDADGPLCCDKAQQEWNSSKENAA